MTEYTDEEIIEWMKSFTTRDQLRTDNFNMYAIVMRREHLKKMMPPKRTKAGNLVGTKQKKIEEAKLRSEETRDETIKRKRLEREKKAEDKRLLKEEKELLKLTKKKENGEITAKHIYVGTKLENGNIICGRCFMEKTDRSPNNSNMCRVCYNRYMYHRMMGHDHNLNNVRDEFCNTKVRHHEKTFEIGIKVDERTEKYLSMIGYDFLFKEPYDETKYHKQ